MYTYTYVCVYYLLYDFLCSGSCECSRNFVTGNGGIPRISVGIIIIRIYLIILYYYLSRDHSVKL